MSKKKGDSLDVAVGKKALRIVPLDLLQVDPSYQRGLVPKHKKIAAEFDPDALGIPLVAQRDDGSLWIVDGQQRIQALRILERKTVRAEVFVSRGCEHEARVFKLVNQNRTKLRSGELFHAMLTEGDQDAHNVLDICKSEGFKVMHNAHSQGTRARVETLAKLFTCVNTLLSIYKRHGSECLRFICQAIKESWPDDPTGVKNEIVGGLMTFWVDQDKTVDLSRLAPRLRTTTPAKILYSASLGVGSRYQGVAEVLERLYRKRLPKS